jgi:hypothetical protein
MKIMFCVGRVSVTGVRHSTVIYSHSNVLHERVYGQVHSVLSCKKQVLRRINIFPNDLLAILHFSLFLTEQVDDATMRTIDIFLECQPLFRLY